MVARSTPASASAVRADGGAWKVKLFCSGRPPTAIAVSRLTMVRSALASTAADPPNAVAGLASRAVVRPAKCTSPAKAMVNWPAGSVGLAGVVDGWVGLASTACRDAELLPLGADGR